MKRCRHFNIAPRNIIFPIIWVTNRCNLRCKMCDQWKTGPQLASFELSTQEWYSFVDSAHRMHAAVITITGGEPLLREDIFEIIRYIHSKGIATHLCTNGTLLNEITVDKLRASGPGSISVSLDSYCPQVHNNLRGVDCFDNVVKGIKLLRRKMPGLKIGINYTITRQNFRNMHRMIPFVEALGVNQIKFDPIHTNLMHRKKSLYSFRDLIFNKDDLPDLCSELDKLIDAISQTKLLTNSPTFIKGMQDLFNGNPRKLPCYAGYISCAVDALGRVSICDNFDGNESLREKSLEEIWRSSSFQSLREKVYNCSSYCWDTTHGELNIRCSLKEIIKGFSQIWKEINFYF